MQGAAKPTPKARPNGTLGVPDPIGLLVAWLPIIAIIAIIQQALWTVGEEAFASYSSCKKDLVHVCGIL
jgi:hypothetical protein